MRQASPLIPLILTTITAHVALAGARVTTSLYAISLHASEFSIGILIALFALFPMLFAVQVGRWADRIGLARPMRIGCIVMALGCFIPSVIGGLGVLYFSVLLIGLGFLSIHISIQHAVGALSTVSTRAKSFSWLALGYSTSSFIGPIAAGYLIEHTNHTIAYAVFTCFVVLSFGFMMSGRLRHLVVHQPEPEVGDVGKQSFLDLLSKPELRRVYAVSICLTAAWDLFLFVMPIHCSHLGMSASSIGWILGCFSAATFVVRLAMHWISRHFSEWKILTTGLIVVVICYLLFPFMTSTWSLIGVTTVLGLALGSGQPNVLALLHENSPPGRAGEVVGVRVTIGNATQVVVPLAFGAVGATLGLFPVFWAMAALMSLGVPLAWSKAIEKSAPH